MSGNDEADLLDGGLFGIQLSDSEGEDGKKAPKPEKGYARDAQSEEAFQAVRREYRVKVENGEIWKSIDMPRLLGGGDISKPEAQALLHAVEELFFLRRYGEGARLARTLLGAAAEEGQGQGQGQEGDGQQGGAPGLDDDMRATLRYYESRCRAREREGVLSAV